MYIYLITNKINGKCYVGRTIKSIDKRFKEHCSVNSCCIKLRNAIQFYGSDNFSLNLLDTASNITSLCKKEFYWIKKFNCILNGYNIKNGSENYIQKSPSKTTIKKKYKRKKKAKIYSTRYDLYPFTGELRQKAIIEEEKRLDHDISTLLSCLAKNQDLAKIVLQNQI